MDVEHIGFKKCAYIYFKLILEFSQNTLGNGVLILLNIYSGMLNFFFRDFKYRYVSTNSRILKKCKNVCCFFFLDRRDNRCFHSVDKRCVAIYLAKYSVKHIYFQHSIYDIKIKYACDMCFRKVKMKKRFLHVIS